MLNRQKVQDFRVDFEKAVAQLEKDYGVYISLGTIRFDSNELRAKMTAKVGDAPIKSTREDFNVGDVVKINHKKVDPKAQFRVEKINNKNIKLMALDGTRSMVNASPGLLIKIS
jgi:hypothetical protein|tara:strand:+ start:358 stop:699 length:342 start_codon:yes stop_codon:yes gene_type:complete